MLFPGLGVSWPWTVSMEAPVGAASVQRGPGLTGTWGGWHLWGVGCTPASAAAAKDRGRALTHGTVSAAHTCPCEREVK